MAVTGFRELFSAHAASAWTRQAELGKFLGGSGSWAVDIDEGTVTFNEDLVFPVQLLGTEAYDENTWLWAWANVESHLPPGLLRRVNWIREYGEKHEIPELTTPSASLDHLKGHDLAMVCGGLTRLPYYRGPYENGALYFLVERPPEAVVVPVPQERLATVLTEVISNFDVDHRILVENFLAQQGFTVEQDGSRFVGRRLADGSPCFIEFDRQARIGRMSFDLKP